MDNEDLIGAVLSFILILAVGFMVFAILFAIYDAITSETFDLRRDAWRCTASHREDQTRIQRIGNVDVPMTDTVTVCDQWSRK